MDLLRGWVPISKRVASHVPRECDESLAQQPTRRPVVWGGPLPGLTAENFVHSAVASLLVWRAGSSRNSPLNSGNSQRPNHVSFRRDDVKIWTFSCMLALETCVSLLYVPVLMCLYFHVFLGWTAFLERIKDSEIACITLLAEFSVTQFNVRQRWVVPRRPWRTSRPCPPRGSPQTSHDETGPLESASQVGSQLSSTTRIGRRAKIAILRVQCDAEQEKAVLQAQELGLRQQRRQLEIRAELEAAMIEDEALEQEQLELAEAGSGNAVGTSRACEAPRGLAVLYQLI